MSAFQSQPPPTPTNKGKMTAEMTGYWIGPMPVGDFLNDFLPIGLNETPPKVPKHFADLDVTDGKSIYSVFGVQRDHINEIFGIAPLALGHGFVDGSTFSNRNSEVGSGIRIDGLIYDDHIDLTHRPAQYDDLAIAFELKEDARDIVKDDGESNDDPDDAPFELTTASSEDVHGQLAWYASEVCARQHRCHFFMVYIFHPYARFLRWDRSGVIFSARFNYETDSQPLVDFLWRFAKANSITQGYDPTVQIANEAETAEAKELLKRWAPGKVERPVFKMEVHDPQGIQYFLVWGCTAHPYSPFGRATRGYPAVEVTSNGISKVPVFLKEQWRSRALTTSEPQIIKELNAHGVRYVPTLLCGGDLLGPHQTTRTQEYSNSQWRIGCKELDTRVHTRFIMKEVGMPLKKFPSSKTMMNAIYCAFQGHRDAYEKCDYLHRDVSGGNILIMDNGDGMLNDWDLARKTAVMTEGPRKHERTGTWPFMSMGLLVNPYKHHALHDDLESFYWVVLYYGIRYLPHNQVKSVADIIDTTFSQCSFIGTQAQGGGGKSAHIFHGNLVTSNTLRFTNCQPLESWLRQVRRLVLEWTTKTALDADTQESPSAKYPAQYQDMDVEWVKVLTSTSWPSGDAAEDQVDKTKKKRVLAQKDATNGAKAKGK